jgi:hypothetical protein
LDFFSLDDSLERISMSYATSLKVGEKWRIEEGEWEEELYYSFVYANYVC